MREILIASSMRRLTRDRLREEGIRCRYIYYFGDTPSPGCPWCDETVIAMYKSIIVSGPREEFEKERRIGFCCLRCGVAALDDDASAEHWSKNLDDFFVQTGVLTT